MKRSIFNILILGYLAALHASNLHGQGKEKIVIYCLRPNNINNNELMLNVSLAVNKAFVGSGQYDVRVNNEWESIPENPSGAGALEAEAIHVIYSALQGIKGLSKKELKQIREKIPVDEVVFVSLIRNLANKSKEYEVRIIQYQIYTNHYSASPVVAYFNEVEIQNIETIKNRIARELYNNAEINSRPMSDEELKKEVIRIIKISVRLKHFHPKNKGIKELVDMIKTTPTSKIAFLEAEIEFANEKFESAYEKETVGEMIDWLKLIIKNYETLIDISGDEGLKNEYIKLRRTYQRLLKDMEKH